MTQRKKLLVSAGEAMIEFSEHGPGLWRRAFAGDTLNTAWYARALLDESVWAVAYATRVGEDRYSDEFIAFLEANGLETRFVQRDPERHLGLYVVAVHQGERSFTYWRESAAARRLADDEAALEDAFANADAFYCSGITLAIMPPARRRSFVDRLVEATRRGVLTAFDPNIRPSLWPDAVEMREILMQAAGSCRIVLPSFSDESLAFGDASPRHTAERYAKAGCREVVVKNGPDDTLVLEDDDWLVVTPKPVEPVDTTGAGDSFNGGYLAARLQGSGPRTAVQEGQRIAAIVVQCRGAIAAKEELSPSNSG